MDNTFQNPNLEWIQYKIKPEPEQRSRHIILIPMHPHGSYHLKVELITTISRAKLWAIQLGEWLWRNWVWSKEECYVSNERSGWRGVGLGRGGQPSIPNKNLDTNKVISSVLYFYSSFTIANSFIIFSSSNLLSPNSNHINPDLSYTNPRQEQSSSKCGGMSSILLLKYLSYNFLSPIRLSVLRYNPRQQIHIQKLLSCALSKRGFLCQKGGSSLICEGEKL